MTVKVGPYTFTRARYVPERDWLLLDMGPGSSVIMDYDTTDGDRWFVPDQESGEFRGLEIEDVSSRLNEGSLTVELPSGERTTVVGAEPVLP